MTEIMEVVKDTFLPGGRDERARLRRGDVCQDLLNGQSAGNRNQLQLEAGRVASKVLKLGPRSKLGASQSKQIKLGG